MNDLAHADTRTQLLARAEALSSTEPSFGRFLESTVKSADPEDIKVYPAQLLEDLFRRSYGRLGKRDSLTHKVYFLPGENVGGREVIEIFSADMPFIVDSVLAAIRAKGGVLRFMAHPIFIFDPLTYRVLEKPANGTRLESFLHLHIDPLPDDEARKALFIELDGVLTEVARAVAGWRPMLERVRQVIQSWHDNPPKLPPAALAEAMHFLGWLAEHNFTFLGMREYRLEGEGDAAQLVPVEDSGFGLLEDPKYKFLRSGPDYVEMTPQHVAFLAEPEPLMVTKANVRSRVHRRAHMDYVGIKLYGEIGRLSGELRVIGLFTSLSLATPHTEVPLIRKKISEVMRRSKLDPRSHAGKALMNALDSYPREELFQISETQLFEFATDIASLNDRPRVRVLSRIDRFDNFVSVLVFAPRDRYDSDVRARIGAYLATIYDGRLSAFYPSFPEGELVRVHFIIGRNGGPTPRPERHVLEEAVTELTLTFGDKLARTNADHDTLTRWGDAFPPAYEARTSPQQALADIAVIEDLADERAIAIKLLARPDGLGLKVYHLKSPIPLSDRVPMLENFGFRVIDESTYTAAPKGGLETYIHDMLLAPAPGVHPDKGDVAMRIENAILAVWHGEAESDRLNQLTARAGLSWWDVELLRAFTKYLRQIGIPYSRDYLMNVLAAHPDVATALVSLFHANNDPGFAGHRERTITHAREQLATALNATASLDEDRIIRRTVNLVDAVLRTNAYQRDGSGNRRPALAIKFDPRKIDELPEPKPYREIFVYSPRVEGLHLRFGAIARGGLRWSDRPEDFRTEVLGLVKAQQVKNAIIVPVGAKGAFVPKHLPVGDREAYLREGTACYKIFVSSLLDVTDNIEADRVIPPPDVVRHDADDPYLVVAADKGTATFSDTANAIALDRDFWLGDAFASGGSVGYDHKKMGITARGGWEAVKRHFRELDRDIQTQPFTCVGVGDMSGDVFGNGMLLSPQTRLIAAFDHRDIFIDPDPDPAVSLEERARLFALPRSSWQDYDVKKLSKGGGIYSRSLKQVALYAEARTALGLGTEAVTPNDVIRAILKADVDLIWFGGIGTYVRASTETEAEAGDKANDALRISGRDIRAKLVGEGANLGVTQRGRVEYALAGGRINTDAIDNSAGVNSSDLEVNIKIALGTLTRSGQLTYQTRNEFLASMTDEVAALCLRNNYLQTLALSVAKHRGMAEFPDHVGLIETLERRGILNRRVEFLPTDQQLLERATSGQGLTRPELAVLLAYAKNTLYADLLETSVPDDPYLGKELYRYFPPKLVETFPDTVKTHRLRREVIATVLSNAMINRGGPAFVNEIMGATSADAGAIAAAYAAARDSYETTGLNALLETLDGKVPGELQLRLYTEIEALLTRETLWFLRNERFDAGIEPLVQRYAAGVAEMRAALSTLLPPFFAASVAARATAYETAGVPKDIAQQIAEVSVLSLATDITLVASRRSTSVTDAATAFFGVLEAFGLGRVLEAGNRILLVDKFDRMALDRALANLMRAQRDLTGDVLGSGSGDVASRLSAWKAAHPEAISRLTAAVQGLTEGEVTVSKLSVAAGLLSDLARS